MPETAMTSASGSTGKTPQDERDVVLGIQGLSVDYGFTDSPTHVLRSCDLTLRRGQILGLAGESGCGKSTLAYAATRLLPPPGVITGGQVLLHPVGQAEVDLLRLSDNQLRQHRWRDIAVVFQGAMNSLNPVHTVGSQVADAISAHRKATRAEQRERCAELFRLVGISPDRMSSYPFQLSGGMRQRVMIAMALALDPDVLIMDEPTTALDVVMQRQIVEEIASLRDRLGFSVIFITHDVSLLIEIADEIAIMYAGEIVEQGPSMELFQNPRHPYTRGLLRSFPPLHGPRTELRGIPGAPPDFRNRPAGCPFEPRCPFAIADCRMRRPTLQPSPVQGDGPDRKVACLLHEDNLPTPEGLTR